MTDAETIAVLQKMRRLANDNIPAWPEGQARREISGICTEAIAALRLHESQKQLQADTNAWHEHGMIAPSCVGCPTAEEALKRDGMERWRIT